MGWAVGDRNGRHIGYGVPAICDQPGCGKEIDRGLAYRCGELDQPDTGCGLYFCPDHLWVNEHQQCDRCTTGQPPYEPTPDTAEWVNHVLTDESWARFRKARPEWTARYQARADELKGAA